MRVTVFGAGYSLAVPSRTNIVTASLPGRHYSRPTQIVDRSRTTHIHPFYLHGPTPPSSLPPPSPSAASRSVLYCTVLYCTVLYCTVLYCTVLYCTVLYCTVLYCTVLYCTVLYCTVLYCTVLYCTVMKQTLLTTDTDCGPIPHHAHTPILPPRPNTTFFPSPPAPDHPRFPLLLSIVPIS